MLNKSKYCAFVGILSIKHIFKQTTLVTSQNSEMFTVKCFHTSTSTCCGLRAPRRNLIRSNWLQGLETAAEVSSAFCRSPSPETDEGMSSGGIGPARLRPLVHPLEYWNVWAKMAPVRQQRTRSSPERRECEAVLWKCMAAEEVLSLEKIPRWCKRSRWTREAGGACHLRNVRQSASPL
jgi:hypothetical protein